MKKFSIGSKRENAKQVDITLERKHLVFATVIFTSALLFHMFVYSPYLQTELIIVCFNESQVVIIDNLTDACGATIPSDMTKEEIYEYLSEILTEKELEVNVSGE